jgi:acetoin utilization deacetylase AcuC-like enzyme
MTTAFFTHPACLEHDTGQGHPERPQRLEAVLLALDEPEFGKLERREARRPRSPTSPASTTKPMPATCSRACRSAAGWRSTATP